jgi:ribulose-5-phosphate 4-epimerase/fuculose-1-phosphate aldolase
MHSLFPDKIVVCGKAPAVVPYVDPGFPLAKAFRDELIHFQKTYGQSPKMVLIVNHGLVALGQTSKEVLNIQLMADKWARILWGTYALGGPSYMSGSHTDRIDNRWDEHYRRSELSGKPS